jgi:hypothetical protein
MLCKCFTMLQIIYTKFQIYFTVFPKINVNTYGVAGG